MESRVRKRHNQASHGQPKQHKPKASKNKSYDLFKLLKENVVIIVLSLLLVAGFIMKYLEDYHHSVEKFTDFGEDIYVTMGVPKSASDQEIRAMYRQLSHKWHPDKNPDCGECKEKFMKIKEAYKILSNPELKALYDRTNGRTVDIIPSNTTELTWDNFDGLVKSSGDVWIVQVYSDDSGMCHNFSKHWEEVSSRLSSYAKFGRINNLMNPKTLKKLPIKVQLLPSVIMLYPGGGYDLFPQDALHGYSEFRDYIRKAFPNVVTACKTYEEFKSLAGQRPVMLFHGKTGGAPVPLIIRAAALQYKWAFDTFWLTSDEPIHSNLMFSEDIASSGVEGNNMFINVAFSYINPSVEGLAILYTPGASKILATGSFAGDEIQELRRSIGAMLTVSHPALELTSNSFEHLCMNKDSKRDRFCVIISEAAMDKLDQQQVLEKLTKYEHLAHIGSAFSKHPAKGEESQSQVASADLQLVTMPEKQSTKRFKEVTGSEVMLLDAKREKFCLLGHSIYGCDIEDEGQLEWIGSIAEGAYDTITWYDAKAAFGGAFKDKALVLSSRWKWLLELY